MNWLEYFIDPAWIAALSKTLLHSLWQGSLIAMILALILQHLPEKKASLRYELASLALFMVFVSALCTFIGQLDQQTTIVTETIMIQKGSGTHSDLTFLKSPTYYGVLIWFLGFALLSIRLLMGWLNLIRLRYRSSPVDDWRKTVFIRIKERLKITTKIGLVESPLIHIPATIGYLKPIILLPISSMVQLSPDQLEAVIAHELAHIKRADFLMNIFYAMIETIFYYHPAVWWISSQMQHEREASCDDAAIQLTGDKVTYVNTLFFLKRQSLAPQFSLSMLGKKQSLYRRFNRQLMTPKNNHMTMKGITIVTLLLVALLSFAFKNGTKETSTKHLEAIKIDIQWDQDVNSMDTIPKKQSKNTIRIKTDLDGHRYDLLKENGEIMHFKEDGKKIDPADFSRYDYVMSQLQVMLDTPPPLPPQPPTPPLPDAPPTPPSAVDGLTAPSAPPAPPAPPAPAVRKESNVIILRETTPGLGEMEVQLENQEMMAHERAILDQEKVLRKVEQIELERSYEMEEMQERFLDTQLDLEEKASRDLARQDEALAQIQAKLMSYRDHLAQVEIDRSNTEISQMQLAEQNEIMDEMQLRLAEKMRLLNDPSLDELQIARIKINLQQQLDLLKEHETLLKRKRIIREE